MASCLHNISLSISPQTKIEKWERGEMLGRQALVSRVNNQLCVSTPADIDPNPARPVLAFPAPALLISILLAHITLGNMTRWNGVATGHPSIK